MDWEDIKDMWNDGTILKIIILLLIFSGFVAFIAFLASLSAGLSIQSSVAIALHWFVISLIGYSLGVIIGIAIEDILDR